MPPAPRPDPCLPSPEGRRRRLPGFGGRANLVALEVAVGLAGSLATLAIPRGVSQVRDHLVRASDNAALRPSEASGRTLGNRRQPLEAAYAEVQEVRTGLALIAARSLAIPTRLIDTADRLGGLVYGMLRSEAHT